LGDTTRKIVSELTRNVSSGTLNSTVPYLENTGKMIAFYVLFFT